MSITLVIYCDGGNTGLDVPEGCSEIEAPGIETSEHVLCRDHEVLDVPYMDASKTLAEILHAGLGWEIEHGELLCPQRLARARS